MPGGATWIVRNSHCKCRWHRRLRQSSYDSGNMEISGNLLILENLGNLKYTEGILVYQILFFRDAIENTTSRHVSFLDYSCNYVTMLFKDMFCNSASTVPKWPLPLHRVFHFITVWKRLYWVWKTYRTQAISFCQICKHLVRACIQPDGGTERNWRH